MISFLRSYTYHFLAGLLVIFIISPIPALLLTHETSYVKGLAGIFYDLLHIPSISIPKIDWTHESILFSSQPITNAKDILQDSGSSIPLFPYLWSVYFCSIVRFTFTLLVGFLISLAIGVLFLRVPHHFKKYTSQLRWVPYALSTVILQCSIILVSLSIAKYILIPFLSSIIIICSTSMIIVMQAIKKWLPFLYKTEEHVIQDTSFLINTLFIALISNYKSILASIILSFFYMECIFHTKGLLQFIIQFGENSPTIVTIGLLLIYIPYMIFSFFQSFLSATTSNEQTYPITDTTIK